MSDQSNTMTSVTESASSAAAARKSVLIVEDNPVVANLISVALCPTHYDIRIAGSAAEGLEAAKEHLPDLGIIDVMLPGGMSGLEFCQSLKSLTPAGQYAPRVIILSALNLENEVDAGYRAGADMYLTKPFSPLVLRRIAAFMSGSGYVGSYGRYDDE